MALRFFFEETKVSILKYFHNVRVDFIRSSGPEIDSYQSGAVGRTIWEGRTKFRSIGHPSQKLSPNQILVRHPHCNYNVTVEVVGQNYDHWKERS